MQFNSVQFLLFLPLVVLFYNTQKRKIYMAFMRQLLFLYVLEYEICITDFIFHNCYMG